MQTPNTYKKVRQIVSKIPKGKVTTYGEIAKLVGIKDARIIGWALRGNQDPNVFCHRVVKAGGYLAKNYSLGGGKEQKRRLLKEGITFTQEDKVDIEKHLWIC